MNFLYLVFLINPIYINAKYVEPRPTSTETKYAHENNSQQVLSPRTNYSDYITLKPSTNTIKQRYISINVKHVEKRTTSTETNIPQEKPTWQEDSPRPKDVNDLTPQVSCPRSNTLNLKPSTNTDEKSDT